MHQEEVVLGSPRRTDSIVPREELRLWTRGAQYPPQPVSRSITIYNIHIRINIGRDTNAINVPLPVSQ